MFDREVVRGAQHSLETSERLVSAERPDDALALSRVVVRPLDARVDIGEREPCGARSSNATRAATTLARPKSVPTTIRRGIALGVFTTPSTGTATRRTTSSVVSS